MKSQEVLRATISAEGHLNSWFKYHIQDIKVQTKIQKTLFVWLKCIQTPNTWHSPVAHPPFILFSHLVLPYLPKAFFSQQKTWSKVRELLYTLEIHKLFLGTFLRFGVSAPCQAGSQISFPCTCPFLFFSSLLSHPGSPLPTNNTPMLMVIMVSQQKEFQHSYNRLFSSILRIVNRKLSPLRALPREL